MGKIPNLHPLVQALGATKAEKVCVFPRLDHPIRGRAYTTSVINCNRKGAGTGTGTGRDSEMWVQGFRVITIRATSLARSTFSGLSNGVSERYLMA